MIAAGGAHVVHDPTSNMILASGVAPVPALMRAGVNVGLACDGPACNNGQDMIEAMKDAALLHKVVTREPQALVARDVFAMATRHGARSVGMGDRLGVLKEGYLADVVLIDCARPHLTPLGDPQAALVYAARGADVQTVLVHGDVVVRDGEVTTLDEADIRRRARERALQRPAVCPQDHIKDIRARWRRLWGARCVRGRAAPAVWRREPPSSTGYSRRSPGMR